MIVEQCAILSCGPFVIHTDRDVGFYSFSVTFRPSETPLLVGFRHALEDPSTFESDAEYFFPSRPISGVACADALYFVSRTGCLTQRSEHRVEVSTVG